MVNQSDARLRAKYKKANKENPNRFKLKRKKCGKCKKLLKIDKFRVCLDRRDGFNGYCIACVSIKESGLNARYGSYKRSARGKNRLFKLTLEQFDQITSQRCFYCNNFSKEADGICIFKSYCGIDRIDSYKDYFYSNCVACCTSCNFMKNDMETKEFIERCKMVYLFNVNKGNIE